MCTNLIESSSLENLQENIRGICFWRISTSVFDFCKELLCCFVQWEAANSSPKQLLCGNPPSSMPRRQLIYIYASKHSISDLKHSRHLWRRFKNHRIYLWRT